MELKLTDEQRKKLIEDSKKEDLCDYGRTLGRILITNNKVNKKDTH